MISIRLNNSTQTKAYSWMQTLALVALIGTISCLYFDIVTAHYFYHDDSRYFDNHHGGTGLNLVSHYLALGRPGFAVIIGATLLFVDSVESLYLARLFFLGFVFANSILLHSIAKAVGLCRNFCLIAAFLPLVMYVTPASLIWLVVGGQIMAQTFAFLAIKAWLIKKHSSLLNRWLFAGIPLLASYFTYQAAASYFLCIVPFLFMRNEELSPKSVLDVCCLFFVASILYFVIHKFLFVPIYVFFPELGVHMPDDHTRFALSLNPVVGLQKLIDILSFSLGALLLIKLSSLEAVTVCFIFFLFTMVSRSRTSKFTATLLFALVFVLSNIVNLAAAGGLITFRTTGPIVLIMALYALFWALKQGGPRTSIVATCFLIVFGLRSDLESSKVVEALSENYTQIGKLNLGKTTAPEKLCFEYRYDLIESQKRHGYSLEELAMGSLLDGYWREEPRAAVLAAFPNLNGYLQDESALFQIENKDSQVTISYGTDRTALPMFPNCKVVEIF